MAPRDNPDCFEDAEELFQVLVRAGDYKLRT